MIQVSVITPCYNVARYVAQTIASVRAQTGVTWEHILVDDGSTDDTASVISSLALDERTRLVQRSNRGVSAARNEGVRASTPGTRYLLFLDADDWIEEGMLKRMVQYLDQRPHVGLAYCDPILVDSDGQRLDLGWGARFARHGYGVRKIDPQDPVTPFESVYAMAGIIPSLAVIRRETYAMTPGWDESFGQPCEDTDLFLHLALKAEVHLVPERLANHRIHAGQSVGDRDRLARQHIKLCEKWLAKAEDASPVAGRIVAAHRLLRRVQFVGRLDDARRYLLDGHPVVAARFALGAARRYVFPAAGTVEAVGRGRQRRRGRELSRTWAA